jgi:hypothetical protein
MRENFKMEEYLRDCINKMEHENNDGMIYHIVSYPSAYISSI